MWKCLQATDEETRDKINLNCPALIFVSTLLQYTAIENPEGY